LKDLRCLNQENIPGENQRKEYQAIEQNAFGLLAEDHFPQKINIEAKLHHCCQAAE
jgi:hypothetical protein